jgi:glucose/arabinose dehydrogenase
LAVLALGLTSGLSSGCSSDDSGNGPPPEVPPLGAELVRDGFSHPLFVTTPPGDRTRLFVVERTGQIRIMKNGALLATPFLDITDKVNTGPEQGILGMAFAPDYPTSHMFVLHYVDPSLNVVLSRFHGLSATADVADTTEQPLLSVPQPIGDHNGGTVVFGKDGFLYASIGDGGCCGDPNGHGQDRTELLGSILRLDVSGNGAYRIPSTNPWATHATFRHELWNYGLRNPWRFSFDRSTGGLYIADVGDGSWEEVNVVSGTSTGGENLGWRITEGFECFNGDPCSTTGITMPVLDYGHSEGCAVMGGYVYRGAAIPALRGTYFYADFCAGWVRSFRWVGGVATEQKEYPGMLPAGEQPNSFGEDAAGELYLTTEGGGLYKLKAK